MWVAANALLIHLLWLGSIFVIYFRSPIIRGLQPQDFPADSNREAPARRVVLIITDGLRAESFFRNNCTDVPHIRRLMQQQGLAGIARTRVPTESRPGHIALIAGFYEDPSAVTRGWKENPIDFDTIFNRSTHTYAWGANDVLRIFSRVTSEERMLIDAYDHDLDFSGRLKTYELDEWVFRRVKFFLERKAHELEKQSKIIFFLHLLGLDSAGHIHKPDSDLFLENLHLTDRGIVDIYRYFEQTFPDGKTAFVLTSDHGMTNSGSHGAGRPEETDTPFFSWGAGVANKSLRNVDASTQKTFKALNFTLPLHELEQAQIVPFISALLGIPPPMNNFGTLPRNFINVTHKYYSRAAHINALQILQQFLHLYTEFQNGFFAELMPSFDKLDAVKVFTYRKNIDKYFNEENFEEAINSSYAVMEKALEGIEFYHTYYKNALLLSTTLAMIGWIFYLYQLLLGNHFTEIKIDRVSLAVLLIGFVVLIFLTLQKAPLIISLYIILPVAVWLFALQQTGGKLAKCNVKHVFQFLFMVLCTELMVLSFFYRHFISLVFLLFNFNQSFSNFKPKDRKFYTWLVLVFVLSAFPLLPPSVGYKNGYLTLIGAVIIMGRSCLIKSGVSLKSKLISSLGVLNALFCMYQHSQQFGVSSISLLISWIFLLYSVSYLYTNKSSMLKQRVEIIFFNLMTVYVLMCTSYEPIFVLLLGAELLLALSTQRLPSLDLTNSSLSKEENAMDDLQRTFRLAFCVLLYTLFSFFGTGNIASVSSFDPNIVRCFITTFSPFTIMSLVILKLIIPVFIIICIILGISAFAREHMRSIFISLLLICNVMGLNFLYLVRNRGSWMEIGSSISHFVIMQVTTVVLLTLTFVAKLCLKLNTFNSYNIKFK